MKFTTTALVSALATLAAAETFNFFPTSDLTCQASNGTVSFTVKEIKDAARDSKDGTPKETSARNIATAARCSYSLPYFEVCDPRSCMYTCLLDLRRLTLWCD